MTSGVINPALRSDETRGMWLGVVGVAIFSLTLPFTKIAVAELNPVLVALGRAVVAACLAGILLWRMRAQFPNQAQVRSLLITSLGVVIGFPVFSSIAMQSVPASHGAVVVGLLPLATAVFAAVRLKERPSPSFWGVALLGTGLVIAYALQQGGGSLQWADLALFAAVVSAALGYAEGGKLSQSLGGQYVICWALVLSMPIVLPVTLWLAFKYGIHASAHAWVAFSYVSLFSMFIGFFFWYKGLALGGVARVGQVQLIQPFLTLLGSAVLLGESLTLSNCLFALTVIATVGLGRRMKIQR